jgi:hypothetical protein
MKHCIDGDWREKIFDRETLTLSTDYDNIYSINLILKSLWNSVSYLSFPYFLWDCLPALIKTVRAVQQELTFVKRVMKVSEPQWVNATHVTILIVRNATNLRITVQFAKGGIEWMEGDVNIVQMKIAWNAQLRSISAFRAKKDFIWLLMGVRRTLLYWTDDWRLNLSVNQLVIRQ